MNTSGVLALQLLGDVREELQVDLVGEKGCERRQSSAESEQNLEKGVEGVECIIQAVLALESLSVESNVPVGGVVNKSQQARDNSVQSVT